jgi:hypothetical protein
MISRLVMAITIVAAAPFVAVAQDDEQRDRAPKPTLEEAQKLVQAISSDAAKLKAYCDLAKLQGQMENAVNEHDEKALSGLLARAKVLENDLGPEFAKVTDGLETVEPDSPEGEKFTEIFGHLDENCK